MQILRRFSCFVVAFAILAAVASGDESQPDTTDDSVVLWTDATVLTLDDEGTVYDDGAVAIAGGRIAAVGETAELLRRYPEASRRRAAGKVVMPGLVNTHTHVPMVLFRGLADDLKLMDWLENHIFPAEAKNVDEDFVRWGTRLACLEMIRGGTTTFADMYYFEDAIAEEAARCGLRAVAGQTLIDFPAPDFKTWTSAIAATKAFVERWKGHPLITPAVAPHALYTVSGEHLVEAARLAREMDVPLIVHVAEARAEVEQVLAATGTTPVKYLDQLGVLEDRLLAAHMIWPTDEEIGLLAERGVGVAHCPQSNMKLAAGVAPVPKLLAAGVAVGLGTDGAASNNDLDLWEEIDSAAKLHKVTSGDPTVLNARQALRLATLGAARALDMDDEIGSLEAGKRADLLVVSLDGVHLRPLYDLYSTLVYSTKASDVETVMVEGRVIYDQGRFLTVDVEAVIAKAEEYRDQVRESLAAGRQDSGR